MNLSRCQAWPQNQLVERSCHQLPTLITSTFTPSPSAIPSSSDVACNGSASTPCTAEAPQPPDGDLRPDIFCAHLKRQSLNMTGVPIFRGTIICCHWYWPHHIHLQPIGRHVNRYTRYLLQQQLKLIPSSKWDYNMQYRCIVSKSNGC